MLEKSKSLIPLSQKEEELGKQIVNSAFKVHSQMGPGLLEKIYEVCLEHELKKAGLKVQRQIEIPIVYDGLLFEEGLRLDILVEDLVICEIKAVNEVNPVWNAQILSHLRLTNKRLGYLINFNVSLIKNGIKRFIV
jgi:GxxExxY protein